MQNENSKFKILRERYTKFIYQNYSFRVSKGNLEILFNFRIEPDLFFKSKIIIKNVKKSQLNRVGDRVLSNLVFHLGLMEIPTYWKATCSPEIEIQAGELTTEQIKWWKDLIIRGMGQFFYENKINFRQPNFLKIHNLSRMGLGKVDRERASVNLKNRVLVPMGGGKDSVVTLEILEQTKKELSSFSLNPTDAALKVINIAGFKKPIIVRRKIDPRLLELNRKGFLNGHTPFSAYLAFLSVLVAVIFGQKYIAFSNERSANEGNVKYLGKTINHQYSKSFDFEEKFRDYSKKYLAKNIEYFSFLRPLYEIQIAKLFSKYPQYFDAFLSCNEAYKTNSGKKLPSKKWCGAHPVPCCQRRLWCGDCPKCLFVFVSLYPFIGEKVIKIFKKNLFGDKKLLPIMFQLIGEKGFKPFECVGTKKESLTAFYLSLKKNLHINNFTPVYLLRYFRKNILPKYPHLERESKRIMNSWSNQNFLPKALERDLLFFTRTT